MGGLVVPGDTWIWFVVFLLEAVMLHGEALGCSLPSLLPAMVGGESQRSGHVLIYHSPRDCLPAIQSVSDLSNGFLCHCVALLQPPQA